MSEEAPTGTEPKINSLDTLMRRLETHSTPQVAEVPDKKKEVEEFDDLGQVGDEHEDF